MDNVMDEIQLLQMLQVCDSLFPIGAFTLSNGMETLVQKGDLKTARDVYLYIRNYLKILPYNELGLAALAAKAASDEEIISLDQRMSASRGPYELRMGSKRLCQRFLKTEDQIQVLDNLSRYARLIKEQHLTGCYGIAVGLYVKDHGIDLEKALVMYAYSLISAMVVGAVKLIPLSQMDGQRILNELFPEIEKAAGTAVECKKADIGIGGPGFDISSMEHEILYSRMYIS